MPKPNKTTRRKTSSDCIYRDGQPRVHVMDNGNAFILWMTDGRNNIGFVMDSAEAQRLARVLSPEPRRRKAGGR